MRRLLGPVGLSALLALTACTAPPGTGGEPVPSTGLGHGSHHPGSSGPSASTAPAAPADRVLSGTESFPNGFTVPAGKVWEWAPGTTTTVETRGNIIVNGVLRMRPANAGVVHTLKFVGVNESAMVGGGMGVVASDVGLWVVGSGQLDIVGTRKAGWNRTGTDPTWQAGDDIRVAPTNSGDTSSFAKFTPGSRVPTVSYAGRTYTAEVLNLTRNVRIEGAGNGEAAPSANNRAHIWIGSNKPQTIKYATLRHLGPRKRGTEQPTEGVLGRYPLHFHMMGDGSRGSVVEGVVVRDSGGHAFVPHSSHGITFRDTISFNTFDTAYWWDPDADDGRRDPTPNETNDVRYEHAMAAYARFDPAFRGYRLSGFQLGIGTNMTVTDSVAVGIQGNSDASGYHWPEHANGDNNVWTFKNNTAHNNNADGIFVWQNDGHTHVIDGFVAYRNGNVGIDHGAYNNNYQYKNLTLFGNRNGGVFHRASGAPRQTWQALDTDGITIGDHTLPGGPIVFDGVTIRGQIVVDEGGDDGVRLTYEFRNIRTASGAELTAANFTIRQKRSTITVYRADGTSFRV
jgi:hypothetical protein